MTFKIVVPRPECCGVGVGESLSKHRWFSGRMLACHAGGPGSIPGRCRYVFCTFALACPLGRGQPWCFCLTNDGNCLVVALALLLGV